MAAKKRAPVPDDAAEAGARGRQRRKIDVRLPGFGAAVGRPDDRFRTSGMTWDDDLYAERVRMVRNLGARALDPSEGWIGELLVQVLDRRLSIADLHVAYRRGDAAMQRLLSTKKAPPLCPLLDQYLAEKGWRHTAKIRRLIKRFLDAQGGLERVTTAVLTRDRISTYLATYKRVGWSHGHRPGEAVGAATRNRMLGSIAAFCRWLHETGHLPTNPAATIEFIEEERRRVPVFTSAEYAAYVRHLEADWRDDQRVLAILLLIHTGADVGELIEQRPPYASEGLRVSRIAFAAVGPAGSAGLTRIQFRRTKTYTPERHVPVPGWLADRLRAHVAAQALRPGDLLFPGLRANMIARAHRRAVVAIGRPELRVKDLRHIAAQFWRRAGADLQTVQEWLGHADPKQTTVYAGFRPDAEFEAPIVNRASALLTGEQDVPSLPARRKAKGAK